MYSLSYLEPVCCSMSSSKCCFLTCIQISQEAGQVVWHSHLFQNFPQFIVIYTVKDFSIINKAEIDVFLELSGFFDDPEDVGNLISSSSAFSESSLNIWKFMVHVLLKTGKGHSNSKERHCQRMFKLPHNCIHLTHKQSNTQNSPHQGSTVREP